MGRGLGARKFGSLSRNRLLNVAGMLQPRGLSWGSLRDLLFRRKPAIVRDEPIRLFFCVADHYEPMVDNASTIQQRERVDRWVQEYPKSVAGIADSRGRCPQHTFFYPAEVYTPEHLDQIAHLSRKGFGDVEVHLHHDNDTPDHLRETLETFKGCLYSRHGLLRKNGNGQITYGFIHGNWALDNSRPDRRWCGVNNELTILRETGCYADFTLPSAPSPTQTRIVNRIYYAIDDPSCAKSHNTGILAQAGVAPPADALLLIQGPLMLNWQQRKWGVLPRLENAEIHGEFPPTRRRLKLWLDVGIGVVGQPNWVFVKLHTHGAKERNANVLLGDRMRRFHLDLADFARNDPQFRYYYVTARETAALVHQAEAGAKEPDFDSIVGETSMHIP